MEQEIKKENEIMQEEPHHGKLIAMVIVGVLAVLGVVYATFSLGGAGKVTTIVTKNAAPVVATTTTTPAPVVVPTEAFVITDNSTNKTSATATAKSATSFNTTNSAGANTSTSPSNFKSFSYDATVGKKISVSGTCHDAYYTLLIFDSKDDYRTSPGAARANRAFACGAAGLFTITMDLRDINLPTGNYYLFVADQGSKGAWYNPR